MHSDSEIFKLSRSRDKPRLWNRAGEQARKRMPRQTALLRRLAAGLQGEDLEDMKQILAQFAS